MLFYLIKKYIIIINNKCTPYVRYLKFGQFDKKN